MKKYKYEIRGIDAWMVEDEQWTWNESWHLDDMETAAENIGRALRRFLRKQCSIEFIPHKTYVYDDGDIVEIRVRGTDEPLFAAVPMF